MIDSFWVSFEIQSQLVKIFVLEPKYEHIQIFFGNYNLLVEFDAFFWRIEKKCNNKSTVVQHRNSFERKSADWIICTDYWAGPGGYISSLS